MTEFLASCAEVLQRYGFSYLRGAGTTLLIALVAALTLARRQPVCTPAPAQAENKACPCASGNKDQGGAA